ncbi:hypothetical protein [Chryseobacterium sp. Leaf180]|uniref:hypothetical protein n=1 Tax=Chryseobacterium sp. Leaf180 TaxID=1736289 RepID=UPI00103A17EA|nr:hypothetical protein [Chryseobacterium sp. Leaf180]
MKQKSFKQTLSARIFNAIISFTITFFFLYLALRDNSISKYELQTIYVTLKENPEYNEDKIKSTTYRNIVLTTKEYRKKFKITGMTYEATDHKSLKADIRAGNKIGIVIRRSDLAKLDHCTVISKYNEVYGLNKNDNSYINLKLRSELINNDSRWYYFFVTIGLFMLPYSFIKGKPLISMAAGITTVAVVGMIVLFLTSKV